MILVVFTSQVRHPEAMACKKLLLWLLVLVLVLVLVMTLLLWLASEPRPSGVEGPRAEALADRMLAAIDHRAWSHTGAVRWQLRAGRPLLLWDRQRDVVEARYGDGTRVLLHLPTRRGIAQRGGARVSGRDEATLLERAYADWANDSFWLHAPAKVRAPGTRRALVERDGLAQLLVTYGSGGVTPGDAYLWELGEHDLPMAWRMWVSVLPVGGVRTTWEEWRRLPTGALVAQGHTGPGGISLRTQLLEGAARLEDLTGDEDPFALLFEEPASAPASRPADAP
jgi:hypothetical protein